MQLCPLFLPVNPLLASLLIDLPFVFPFSSYVYIYIYVIMYIYIYIAPNKKKHIHRLVFFLNTDIDVCHRFGRSPVAPGRKLEVSSSGRPRIREIGCPTKRFWTLNHHCIKGFPNLVVLSSPQEDSLVRF